MAKFKDIAYWILIAVVILFCVFIVIYLTGQGKQCLADPLGYFQAVMNKSGATCICQQDGAFAVIK